MSLIFKKLSKKIITNPQFINDRNKLFESYVQYLIGENSGLERSIVSRVLKTVQIFCKSKNQALQKEGFVLLSILLDVTKSDYPDIKPIANSLFIEAGDFPNIVLLDRLCPSSNIEYGLLTTMRYFFKEEENTVTTLDYKLTNYQKDLWEQLNSDKNIITIAPTSAGKTHIILTYLVNKMLGLEECFVAIIVPTRALISEVTNKIYGLIEKTDIELCTIPQQKDFASRTIFIMTQERLYEQIVHGDLAFNYLFIDEAHNIADESRGVLLHLTIETLLEKRAPQVIVSMPSDNYRNAFDSVFKNIDFHVEKTDYSPVSKILFDIKLKGRKIEIIRHNSDDKILIPKNFKGSHLSEIVYRLGKNQSNIIYHNRTDDCENTANKIAEIIKEFETTETLEEAASYIEEFIHEKFSLAANIRKGVAFHYGPLPGSLRIMIENLVKMGEINYICCTSTLAEGVNLPAKNLFLKNPLQIVSYGSSEKLEDVKVKNIIGRAGRMLEHFSGNVFLIDPDSWKFQNYFDEEESDSTKIPSYYKIINSHLESLIDIFSGKVPSDLDMSMGYTVSNKLIKEFLNGTLYSNTLSVVDLTISQRDLDRLKVAIEDRCKLMKLPPFILGANPTIGYIQQDALFDFLNNQIDLDLWILPHPKSTDFYISFMRILEKLSELGLYDSGNYPLTFIAKITKKWILGRGLKEIINEQVKNDKNYSKAKNINSSVRNIIKIINNEIRFRLENVLGCYHELLTYVLRLKSIEKPSVMLHSYLEIGACDSRMINLINIGLSREAAYEIERKLSKQYEVETMDDLRQLFDKGEALKGIHPVTKKEILSLIVH